MKSKSEVFKSPAEGNAFGLAMQKTGGDYKAAKAMLDASAINYGSGSPFQLKKAGDKKLSGSERRNKQEGINVKSPKIQAQYDKYKKSGGKLSINQAARIGFATPEESRRRMKQANIPGSQGRDALKGV